MYMTIIICPQQTLQQGAVKSQSLGQSTQGLINMGQSNTGDEGISPTQKKRKKQTSFH